LLFLPGLLSAGELSNTVPLFSTAPRRKKAKSKNRKPQWKSALAKKWHADRPFEKFYPAEDYHQDYLKKHPENSYVKNVSIPRLIEAGFKP